MSDFKFAVRDDLVEVQKDPEDGTPVLARSLYVICELGDGTRLAHDCRFFDREPVRDEEFGTVWVNREQGAADAEAEALRLRIERAVANPADLNPQHWAEIDPAYGSDAYQDLDSVGYFRARERQEAREAGENVPVDLSDAAALFRH